MPPSHSVRREIGRGKSWVLPVTNTGDAISTRRLRLNRQGVDIVLHHLAQGGVYRAVTRQRGHTSKRGADDAHAEVTMPFGASAVAGVFVAVIADIEFKRGEGGGEAFAHFLDADRVQAWDIGFGITHGSTLRTGRTSVR